MTHRFSRLFGAAALAATVSLPAAAQEYSNGGTGDAGRGPAILTPVEAFGVHPPGLAPVDAKHWRPYIPYYAPLSPVASSTRWRPWANYFLLPYYTPYYPGYSPRRHWNPPPRPYGSNGWGAGPRPEMPLPEEPGTTPLEFGPYTSVVADDTVYWNMGGNGLVPYGSAPPVEARAPDLIDAIQGSRPRGRFRRFFGKAPAIVSPLEEPQEHEREDENSSHRRIKPPEPIPPGETVFEEENDGEPDDSSHQQAKPAESSPKGELDDR
jgi:hypothetical protein